MLNSDMDEQEMLELQVEEASESPLRRPFRLLMGAEKGMEEGYDGEHAYANLDKLKLFLEKYPITTPLVPVVRRISGGNDANDIVVGAAAILVGSLGRRRLCRRSQHAPTPHPRNLTYTTKIDQLASLSQNYVCFSKLTCFSFHKTNLLHISFSLRLP